MAIVNQVDKKVRMTTREIVKFQLLTHCFLVGIVVSDADLECLAFLAMEGDTELMPFCIKASERGIFLSVQSVRNCLNKAQKKDLVVKEKKNKKKIYINPELNISASGNIML